MHEKKHTQHEHTYNQSACKIRKVGKIIYFFRSMQSFNESWSFISLFLMAFRHSLSACVCYALFHSITLSLSVGLELTTLLAFFSSWVFSSTTLLICRSYKFRRKKNITSKQIFIYAYLVDVSLFLIPFLRSSPVHINACEQCLHKMWVTPSNNIDRALIVAYAHLIVLTCNQFQRILLFIVSTIYTFFLHFSIFSFAMCMQVTESVCAFFCSPDHLVRSVDTKKKHLLPFA